jgi:hypothetical protein
MGRTHEVALTQMKFYTVKDHEHTYKFYLNLFFFDGTFEYGGISKFGGYVGTNDELLCVEFCNFGQ